MTQRREAVTWTRASLPDDTPYFLSPTPPSLDLWGQRSLCSESQPAWWLGFVTVKCQGGLRWQAPIPLGVIRTRLTSSSVLRGTHDVLESRVPLVGQMLGELAARLLPHPGRAVDYQRYMTKDGWVRDLGPKIVS